MHNTLSMVIKINTKLTVLFFSVTAAVCLLLTAALSAADVKSSGIELPIIMYHHISEDPSALNAYVISPGEFEGDIRYLKERGFDFVLPEDIRDYVENGSPLPEKPIIISFDDGFESTLEYAYPLCEKYGLKFVLAVIGREADRFSEANDHNILYSYLTWDEIRMMNESGKVETANHTYNLHSDKERKGANIIKGESKKEYEQKVAGDILKMQKLIRDNSGVNAEVFVYPFGFICGESVELIKKTGFKMSFSCYEGINIITDDPKCLYCMKRYNRPHGITSEAFFKKTENR